MFGFEQLFARIRIFEEGKLHAPRLSQESLPVCTGHRAVFTQHRTQVAEALVRQLLLAAIVKLVWQSQFRQSFPDQS